MLRTETNTRKIEQQVRDSFDYFDGQIHETPTPVFEHGQWWISCNTCGAQWSVHDLNDDDFDFEEVSVGDGDCESEPEDTRPADWTERIGRQC